MIGTITPEQVQEKVKKVSNRVTVNVKVGKLTFEGIVTGARNRFATVTIKVPVEGAGASIEASQEYSWDAVTNHINTGKSLIW